jgi:hypothetical protein
VGWLARSGSLAAVCCLHWHYCHIAMRFLFAAVCCLHWQYCHLEIIGNIVIWKRLAILSFGFKSWFYAGRKKLGTKRLVILAILPCQINRSRLRLAVIYILLYS